MGSRNSSSDQHPLGGLVMVVFATTALLAALASQDAVAQGNAATTQANRPGPVAGVKAPPLPNGSAQAVVKAGMSDKDWENAYKETGRPRFDLKQVKRIDGNVERE